MADRASLVLLRMEERLAAICAAVPPINPGLQYWLDSDAGPSYCRKCVIAARGREFELGPPLEDAPFYRRTDLEDAFHDGIDGGFDTTSDSTSACETCGTTLSYILTDYGVEQEINYYREAPICALRDEDSYALDRLALNIWEGSPRHMILGALVAVNQAWRLLQQRHIDEVDQ
ncbi:hypothetical protein [Novosphingobium pentaromativorans]|nr:hypothetical protein [Novosphingobium pentaromativorans]